MRYVPGSWGYGQDPIPAPCFTNADFGMERILYRFSSNYTFPGLTVIGHTVQTHYKYIAFIELMIFFCLKLGAERKVSYDNGPDSSVAEDTYFGILAASQGYSFDFIHGNMCEKSPFSLMDFLQQRKRWLQGLLLVAHSSRLPFRYTHIFFMP